MLLLINSTCVLSFHCASLIYFFSSACIDVYLHCGQGGVIGVHCATHNRLCFNVSYLLSYKLLCCWKKQNKIITKVSNYLCCQAAIQGRRTLLSLWFVLSFPPQVPKLCPLSVLLNPVLKERKKEIAASCELKVNSAPTNLADMLRNCNSIRLDCRVSAGRPRASLQLWKAEFGEQAMSSWLIDLYNMHLQQTAKSLCKILNAK